MVTPFLDEGRHTYGFPVGSQQHGAAPPGFPGGVPVRRQRYRNWLDQIHVDDVWVCTPRSAADVVAVANWARSRGYRVRASGHSHTASPLVLTDRQPDADRVVLADTREHLTGMSVEAGAAPGIRVGTGVSLRELAEFAERHGFGLPLMPLCGELTVGGVLAVGGHGTGASTAPTAPTAPGAADGGSGSLSDLVAALTAVVWDKPSGEYVLRTFHRSDPDTAAFLTHLGRAFITEVTLSVVPDYPLRCVSEVTIPAGELLAAPEKVSSRSLAALVDRCGRVDVVWFPQSERTWVRTFEVEPERPPESRPVVEPYNFPFTDHVPESVSRAVSLVVSDDPRHTAELGEVQYAATVAGLAASASADLWGLSKNLLLSAKPNILRYAWNGYAILTSRDLLQRVVHEYGTFFRELVDTYRNQDRYPVNGPVQLRITGLDRPRVTDAGEVQPPALSPVRADPENPHWDVAVWANVLSFPGTEHAESFYRDFEEFVFGNYRAPYACARPEWAKGWAYTAESAWSDPTVLSGTVPAAFGDSWDWAVSRLHAHDPHRVFGNPFLDRLLVAETGGAA